MSSTVAPVQQHASESGGSEARIIKEQLQRGEFTQLRKLLAQTQEKHDWQDRFFMLDLAAGHIATDRLEALCVQEPEAADLALIRGVNLFDLVYKSRGGKVAEHTSKEQFEKAARFIKEALPALQRAAQLNPTDPTAHVFTLRVLPVFHSNNYQALKNVFQSAITLAADSVPAHWAMINVRAKKWGGSHEEALQIARSAQASAKPGSDLAGCLFFAHILVWEFVRGFDKNKAGGDAYLKNSAVVKELNDAFDRWTQSSYQPQRSSVPYLQTAAFWFYKSGDRDRLSRALSLTSGAYHARSWSYLSKPQETYAAAVAMSQKKSGILGWFK